ncbi:MAG: hypothetical protein V5A23_09180 [Halobacteriales archaeon]
MDVRQALKWTAIYRGTAWLLGLVALGSVYLGYYLSLGGAPLTLDAAIEGAGSVRFAVPALLGVLVWQAGKTVAYYKTVSQAIEREIAKEFDAEMIKSDILSVLDERLADMQTQIEGTRRAVEDTGSGARSAQTGGFDFENEG